MGVLEAEGVKLLAEALGGILLHIPRFVVRELDRRGDRSVCGETAVGGLIKEFGDVAHDLVTLGLGDGDRILVGKREREVEHAQLAKRRGGRCGERADKALRAAGDALALHLEASDLFFKQRDVAPIAEVNDLTVRLDSDDLFRNGLGGRGGERGLA